MRAPYLEQPRGENPDRAIGERVRSEPLDRRERREEVLREVPRELVRQQSAEIGFAAGNRQADSFCSSSLSVACRMTGSLFLRMTSSEITTSRAVF